MASIPVLVVDPAPEWLNVYRDLLSGDERLEFFTTGSALEALKILRDRQIELVISELGGPNFNGVGFIEKILDTWPSLKIII